MENTLPKNWVISNIEDSVEILDNKRKPVSATERAKRIGDIPYYGATGIAGKIDDFIFDEELVLLGEDGAPFLDYSKDVAYLISGKSWVNNHAHVLKAKKNITSNIFLLHFLNQFDYTNYVGGTTRLKLNQGNLKSIPFPLPPQAEQQRIVAKLDVLFTHLEHLKTRLDYIPQLLKNFRQAVLTQAVTGKLTEKWRVGKELEEWSNLKIDDIVNSIDAGKSFKCPEYPVEKGQVGLVKISAVTWNVFNSKETKTVTDKSRINKKYFINSGDFLISRANTLELVGASVIVDNIEFDIMLSDKVWRVNFIDDTTKIYAHNFLKSFEGRVEIESRATGNQLSMRNLSQNNFKDIDIPIPPKEEQTEIVKRVEALFAKADTLETQYQSLKTKIDRLPQAILAKAFKGELVEQLSTDGSAKELLEEIKKLKAELVTKSKVVRKKN